MRNPEPRVEIDIRGTMVGFVRRDVRQVNDHERRLVEWLVDDQQREASRDGQSLTRIVIDTDYPDYDRLAYTASYRAELTERMGDAPPEERHGRGEH
jgi:hypothetical protein